MKFAILALLLLAACASTPPAPLSPARPHRCEAAWVCTGGFEQCYARELCDGDLP